MIASVIEVEVKVCTTAPEKYDHSRKLPYPDLSAIIQAVFLCNQPCQITTNPNACLSVLIKINSKQRTLIVKVQESTYSEISAAFLFKKNLFIGRQNNNIHKLVTYRCCMLIHRQVQFHNYSRSRTN